jgi:hypothetical protein
MLFDISLYICKHTLRRACTCARVCAVCSFALRDKGGGVQLDYAEDLSLGVGFILGQKER